MLISETERDGNEVWTVDDVADYLKMGRQTVSRMAARGELPAKKVGRQWRFKREQIIAYLDTDISADLREKLSRL
jgi:excisionase family DNA binding protein